MSDPTSGQMPIAMDSDATRSHTPVGQPAIAGAGRWAERAKSPIPRCFLTCAIADLTKKTANRTRPINTMMPSVEVMTLPRERYRCGAPATR